MKKTDIAMDMLDSIDEKHIAEAVNYKKTKKHRSFSFGLTAWQKGLVAACVAIVVMVGVFTMPSMINSAIAAEPTPKPVDIFNDFAYEDVKYVKTDTHEVDFYGKLGYEWFISNEHPELYLFPEIITPDVFGDVENLRNAIIRYNMSDYAFEANEEARYHVNVTYSAWSMYKLDNDDKTVDWHDKAAGALIKMIKDSCDYDTKKPEVIAYDPSLFSEDLNYCNKDSAVAFVTADGDLVYSYVEGKLSCIWFYACDTLYEIYSNYDENSEQEDPYLWLHSLDGWLSDLASIDTAPRAAAKFRQIAEDSWQIRYDYIHSLPENEEN